MTNKLTCYVIGVDSLLIRCSEILLEKGHNILGVITSEQNIKNWAAGRSLKVIDNDSNLINNIKNTKFDYLFSITNFDILPNELINLAGKGAINFHDGPLPRYAGINATSWALMNQEKSYGITWHEITSEIDKGDILKQVIFDIDEDETALSLNARCFEAGAEAFELLVDDLSNNTLDKKNQDFSTRSYFGKYKRPENFAIINWNQPADKIMAFARSLNFGRYTNPLGLPKIFSGNHYYLVSGFNLSNRKSTTTPGTISEIGNESLFVATETMDIEITSVQTITGEELSITEFETKSGIKNGSVLSVISDQLKDKFKSLLTPVAKNEDYWVEQLRKIENIELSYQKRDHSLNGISMLKEENIKLSSAAIKNLKTAGIDSPASLAALFAMFIGRHSKKEYYTLGLIHTELEEKVTGAESLLASVVPVNITSDSKGTVQEEAGRLSRQISATISSLTYVKDIFIRHPELHNLISAGSSINYPAAIMINKSGSSLPKQLKSILTFAVDEESGECKLIYDSALISEENLKLLKGQFITFAEEASSDPALKAGNVSIISPAEREILFNEWNNTKTSFSSDKCIHNLFEEQAAKTPDAVAVFCKGTSLTYSELNQRSSQLARKLQKAGVGPDTLVGISLHRSVNMMVSILGVLKAGGAYVPLDPDFPRDRILYMIEDSKCPVIITEQSLRKGLSSASAKIISIDTDWTDISKESAETVASQVKPENLSYVIYTSGSTGKPKGVMVQHRNVVNFFTGMDSYIQHDPPGVWLAVTSLSFDISVLELLWTLTRGFKVVIYAEEDWKTEITGSGKSSQKRIDFSLFYFSSYASENSEDKYRLLIEGAKFADLNRFAAVWTPERHFHDFGGLYPNPAVTGAGIATVTKHVRIMSGSCVSPLHSPIRIAEDWSIVDNLSNGRVGISFAAGWQPNDFVLMPENYERRKDIMFEQIEIVKKLWKGEAVEFPSPKGNMVAVKTLPRPVQKELPIWITAANNPETFRMAGEGGFNLLTHLLGQHVEDLREKIDIYKKAWKDSGHPGDGYVSVMLHTFVGENLDEVKEIVREPMKQYLKSSVNLVQLASWYFPTFDKLDSSFEKAASQLSPEDMDAILDHSFERYFETSALLGTPETCLKMVTRLKDAGVDDVACLIDFGVPSETVLSHLQYLNAVKTLSNLGVREKAPASDNSSYSIPELIRSHKVTHLQCTPSMAKMLMMNDEARREMKDLNYLMVGGEAFPVSLARQLKENIKGSVLNMYGPTETTIWSSVYKLDSVGDSIPIGRPIANTDIFILDQNHQLVPTGVPGELCIGGEGVVRGYFERPELTSERFIPNPYDPEGKSRLYKTGDLACYRNDGIIEFLGRLDHQVKIRGYRIELGEIETALEKHNKIREAVVIAREDSPGDKRLVGYLVTENNVRLSTNDLRSYLRDTLPEYMIPSLFVTMDSFPLTPNGKVDRKALPAPEAERPDLDKEFIAPRTPTEQKLSELWGQILNIDKIGVHDNFFDLGGHSLSAVQVTVKVQQTYNVNLSLQTFFQSATLEKLATAIDEKLLEQAENSDLEKLLREVEQSK